MEGWEDTQTGQVPRTPHDQRNVPDHVTSKKKKEKRKAKNITKQKKKKRRKKERKNLRKQKKKNNGGKGKQRGKRGKERGAAPSPHPAHPPRSAARDPCGAGSCSGVGAGSGPSVPSPAAPAAPEQPLSTAGSRHGRRVAIWGTGGRWEPSPSFRPRSLPFLPPRFSRFSGRAGSPGGRGVPARGGSPGARRWLPPVPC